MGNALEGDLRPLCPSLRAQEPPRTPRRAPAPRQTPLVPKLQKSQGKATSPAPMEPSPGEDAEAGDLLLPPSVSGLAPLILAAGSKPSQAPQARNRFQELKETVAQTLGSLDPAWLRRCQGAPVAEGTKAAEGEQGEGVCAPLKQEEGGGGEPGGDSNRKRPRGGGGQGAEAPAKRPRCHQGSAEGAVGAGNGGKRKKKSKEAEEEEEEQKEAPKELRKVMEPLENLLGEVEEEEKPRSTRKVIAAR